MKQLTDLPNGHIYRLATDNVFGLTIELALTTGIRLLICGNRLPFYDIAYALARRVGQHYEIILKEEITFSRAETCIQLVDFLEEMEARATPLLVSDLLARFYDEEDHHVDELFFTCQIELQRLSKTALVFVSADPRSPLERLGHVLSRTTREVERINCHSEKSQRDDEESLKRQDNLFPQRLQYIKGLGDSSLRSE
ncbi:MAG: hypothetical protein ISR58_16895 [Anaerolineales bacterium]|nr:hypothetical protein [Anaerolineales bacterium]